MPLPRNEPTALALSSKKYTSCRSTPLARAMLAAHAALWLSPQTQSHGPTPQHRSHGAASPAASRDRTQRAAPASGLANALPEHGQRHGSTTIGIVIHTGHHSAARTARLCCQYSVDVEQAKATLALCRRHIAARGRACVGRVIPLRAQIIGRSSGCISCTQPRSNWTLWNFNALCRWWWHLMSLDWRSVEEQRSQHRYSQVHHGGATCRL
mmetsp:Transcript_37758/g.121441  ORF Transcript_37758/g.121441 Transcript_37758/m.121441 type:complete len:211 (-) Transcript_37758:89-721(-)